MRPILHCQINLGISTSLFDIKDEIMLYAKEIKDNKMEFQKFHVFEFIYILYVY